MKIQVFLALWIVSMGSWAQNSLPNLPNELTFQRFTTNEGLSNNYITEVAEDRQHFIWAMTLQGINRLDGTNVRQYTLEDSSKINGQPYNRVLVDYKGDVWAVSNASLFKFDPIKDKFELKLQSRYSTFLNINSKLQPKFAMMNDTLGRCFWIAKEDTLVCYHIDNEHFEKMPVRFLDTPSIIFGLNATTLIIATNREWISYDKRTKKINRVSQNAIDWAVNVSKKNHWIYTDVKDRNIWEMGYENGVFSAPKLIYKNNAQNEVRCITTLPQQTADILWLGLVGRGVWLLDIEGKNNYDNFSNRMNETNKFYYLSVLHIFQDSRRNIWIATKQGLHRTSPDQFQIHKESYPFFSERKINRVVQVVPDARVKNREWIATAQLGLYLYDKVAKKVIKTIETKGHQINQIQYDKYNRLWVLGNGVITIIDPLLNIKTILLPAPKSNFVSWRMAFDTSDNLWMATEIGLMMLNTKSYKATVFDTENSGLSATVVYDFTILKDHTMALATKNGLDIFDPLTKKVVQKIGERKNMFCVIQDSKGTIWMTSLEKLYKVSGGHVVDSWANYGKNKKMFLKTLIPTKKSNYVWGNDNSGLLRFDPVTEKFRLFTERDGLVNNYFYGFIYENNGYLYLNHEDAVNYFDPTKAQSSAKKFEVILTDFYLLDTRQSIDLMDNKQPFRIKYDQNVITFKYTVIDFERPDALCFRYQLEGFDKNWKNADTRREATYTNLNGGDYTFKVQALNEEGEVISTSASFMFLVATPYYRTWWFLCLVLLSLGALFYGTYRYRLAQILNLQNLRNRISRDLHDEVGSTLSSIAMLSASAKSAIDTDHNRSKMLIENISINTQKILENMDDIVWAINPREDSFESILSRMSEYAYSITESKEIKLYINEDAALNKVKIQMQKRRNLYLIFKETVINAAKHSGCTEMKIDFKVIANSLSMRIADNGKGFDINQPTSRNGLRNMTQRVKEINGKIEIKSKMNEGTTMSLSIPL